MKKVLIGAVGFAVVLMNTFFPYTVHAASGSTNEMSLNTPAYTPVLPEGGSDEYRCFILNPKLIKGAYLQSVSISPDNPDLSHHGILYRLPSTNVNAAKTLDSQSTAPGWSCFGDTGVPGASAFGPASSSSWISFWAPGGNFKQFPAGTGMSMSSGDQFIIQVHFHVMSGIKLSSASMKVSLKYATTKVKQLNTLLLAAPIELPCSATESGPLCDRASAIADLAKRTSDKASFTESGLLAMCGGDPRNPVASAVSICTQTLRAPIKIYGSTGHMHQLGKSIAITLQDGVTGKIIKLSNQSVWNFDNQKTVWLKKPLATKAGDILQVTCTFDTKLRSMLPAYMNQPARYVVWGEGTEDEMCLAIINFIE